MSNSPACRKEAPVQLRPTCQRGPDRHPLPPAGPQFVVRFPHRVLPMHLTVPPSSGSRLSDFDCECDVNRGSNSLFLGNITDRRAGSSIKKRLIMPSHSEGPFCRGTATIVVPDRPNALYRANKLKCLDGPAHAEAAAKKTIPFSWGRRGILTAILKIPNQRTRCVWELLGAFPTRNSLIRYR